MTTYARLYSKISILSLSIVFHSFVTHAHVGPIKEDVVIPEICREMAVQIVRDGKFAMDFDSVMDIKQDFKSHKDMNKTLTDRLRSVYESLRAGDSMSGKTVAAVVESRCVAMLADEYKHIIKIDNDIKKDNGTLDLAHQSFSLKNQHSTSRAPSSARPKELCISDKEEECHTSKVISGIGVQYEKIMSGLSAPFKSSEFAGQVRYDEQDCLCLEKKISKKTTTTELSAETEKEKKRLEDVVLRAKSLKTLNQIAAVMEDLRYYGGIEADTLAYNGSDKISDDVMFCSDANSFKKEVDELCRKNNMAEGSEKRMSDVLSGLNRDLKGLPFSDALKGLSKDVGVLNVRVKENGEEKTIEFQRLDYDKARRAMGKDEPELRVANRILSEILKNPILEKSFSDDDSSPLYAILNILDHPDKKIAAEVDKMFIDLKQKLGDNGGKVLTKLIEGRKTNQKDPGNSEYYTDVKDLFHIAQTTNPGFKNLLNDRDLFKQTKKDFNTDDPDQIQAGLFSRMNDNKSHLMKRLADRCKESQKEMAITVCTPKEDMIKQVTPLEMSQLLSRDVFHRFVTFSKDPFDMAVCSLYQNPPFKSNSPFRKLIVDGSYGFETSDYYDSRFNSDEQRNGFHAVALMLQNKAAAEQLKNSFRYNSQGVKTLDRFQSSDKSESSQFSFGNGAFKTQSVSQNQNFTPAQVEVQHTREPASISRIDSAVQNEVRAATQYMPPSTFSHTVAPVQQDSKVENKEVSSPTFYRDRLSKDIQTAENKERVKEHLSSVNDKDADEIYRLRDQALKDSQTISQLRIEQERMKAESMKAQYDDLKSKYETLEKSTAAPVNPTKTHSISTGGSGSASEGVVPQFENGYQKNSGTQMSNLAKSTGAGFSSGSSSFTSASISDSSGSSSNAVGGNVSATSSSGGSESRGLALTVTQSRSVDGQTAQPEDPNRVLINYLTKNEPSAQQLHDLKNLGLVLTEEEVSKDGQKVSVKKTIKFSELSSEAKTFVEKKLAEVRLLEVKRNYSRQVLLLELLQASSKNSNHNVMKTGSLRL